MSGHLVTIEVDGEKRKTKYKYVEPVLTIVNDVNIATSSNRLLGIGQEDELMLSLEEELKKILFSHLVKAGRIVLEG